MFRLWDRLQLHRVHRIEHHSPAAFGVGDRLTPFFPGGSAGLLQAMGYTFIALQGFDLIAAVGGEVKQPERNIPRAMVLSLTSALVIYIPLLFLVVAVGTPGQPVADAAAARHTRADGHGLTDRRTA